MSGNNGSTTGGRDDKGRFTSGNPGRPKGARHRTTRHVEALMQGDVEELTRAVIEAAKRGDMTAARIVLDRIAPARREPTVEVDLPRIESAADLPAATAAVVDAVAAGEVSPGEAQRLAALIAEIGKALEVHDLEARIAALEERLNATR